MVIINLSIYMGFDCEIVWGVTLQSLFTVNSLVKFLICYPHKIKIAKCYDYENLQLE